MNARGTDDRSIRPRGVEVTSAGATPPSARAVEHRSPELLARPGPWVVATFGEASLATPQRWERVRAIARARVDAGQPVLFVMSALASVSDRLAAWVDAMEVGRGPRDGDHLDGIRAAHVALGDALRLDVDALIGEELDRLAALAADAPAQRPLPSPLVAEIMAAGERLSTRLAAAWLTACGLPCAWVDARELLTVGPAPGAEAQGRLDALDAPLVITQGAVARDVDGATTRIEPGGSDTSAAYLAVALAAPVLEIWTDMPGLFTADPREVASARMLSRVGHRQAEVLASMGAGVVHPRALGPARRAGLPIAVRCVDRPDMDGTRVTDDMGDGEQPFAVASRDGLALLQMRRESDWQPVGFMADVAERFRALGISMDLVATSPGEIRATVDRGAHSDIGDTMPRLVSSLADVCAPTLRADVASVSVVGERVQRIVPMLGAALRTVVDDASVHMWIHGADDAHATWIVDADIAPTLVRALHALVAGAIVRDAVAQTPTEQGPTLGPSWSQVRPAPAPRPHASLGARHPAGARARPQHLA